MLEKLESRRLLAVTAVNNAGVLTITGDSEANYISVSRNLDNNHIIVRYHDVNIFDGAASEISSIRAELLGGADRLTIAQNIEKPTTIHGGEGNDTIYGGGGLDEIYGDFGNDVI